MQDTLLDVRSISAAYGKVSALRDVSIKVLPGEIVAVLGANGAGKSTLLNCISGVVPVSAGEIYFEGKPIRGLKPWQLSACGISHVPEGREIFPSMTVEENLSVVDSCGGGPRFTMAEILDIFPRLRERIDQNAGNLSGGEQQMLAIGRGLMAAPKLILLDEPSLGLSPVLSKLVLGAVSAFCRRGLAAVLVEQNVRAALKISDRAYVLRVGRVVHAGTADELANSTELREAYLGV